MPESVEIFYMTQSLNEHIQGKTLTNIDVHSGRYLKKPETFGGFNDFIKILPKNVIRANCKGKFIYIEFGEDENCDNWYLFVTLGMTGSWRVIEEEHSHVEFTFEETIRDEENHSIWFTDQQGYGTLKFVKGKKMLEKKLRSLGQDMLADNITDEDFIEKYRKHNNKNVCIVILDQKVFSGAGNYIKSEALYRAGISPLHKIEELTNGHLIDLFHALKAVIQESLASHGMTFRTYADVNGQLGTYKNRVYNNKTGKDHLGNKIIHISPRESPDGRGTYWVPAIQK